jgi:hypothetical protein
VCWIGNFRAIFSPKKEEAESVDFDFFIAIQKVGEVATLSITHRMIIGIQRVLQTKKGA